MEDMDDAMERAREPRDYQNVNASHTHTQTGTHITPRLNDRFHFENQFIYSIGNIQWFTLFFHTIKLNVSLFHRRTLYIQASHLHCNPLERLR